MKKIIRFLLNIVNYFTPEVYDDEITVKKCDGVVRHMEVPGCVLRIYRWYGLFYETSTKTPLPSNCLDTLSTLSLLNVWKGTSRNYLTLHEWFTILNSTNPEKEFTDIIKGIEKRFVIPK